MGLLDFFRPRVSRTTDELWERFGRLEANVASVTTQWETTRAEFTRLALRLEKREQRAALKETAAVQEGEQVEHVPVEVAAARALRARRGNGILPRRR